MDPSGLLSHPARLAGTRLLRLQSDERLVELARAGHEPAFDAIVHRYRPALLRSCARILGPERAEDAVQQALASAHTAMTTGDDRHLNLRPWLYRIAHNTALNLLRGSRREEVELVDTAFAAPHTPEDQVAQRERLESVLAAIAALPESQRDALLLRELEGRSHEEIGRALGVTTGAARAALFRARSAVRTACSALTPTPLLLRVAELGGDGSSHVAAKAVAGVLAGCAIVGGGAASTGVIGGTHHPSPPASAEASAPQHATQATRTAPTEPATTTAAPAGHASRAAAPVAALRPVAPPKPVRVPKAKPTPKPKPKPKPRRAPQAAPPAPAPAPAAAPATQSEERPTPAPRRPASHPRPQPAVGQGHGQRPDHDVPRGRGHAKPQPAPVAPEPAAEPVEQGHGNGNGNGHAYGRQGRPDDEGQAIEGVSGKRDKAASMSDSENSGSSKAPDK